MYLNRVDVAARDNNRIVILIHNLSAYSTNQTTIDVMSARKPLRKIAKCRGIADGAIDVFIRFKVAHGGFEGGKTGLECHVEKRL